MLTPFHAKISRTQSIINLQFTGRLDENANLPEIESSPTIRIDLQNLESINSIGVRKWSVWSERFKPPTKVILSNCPTVFMKSASLLRGFLTPCMVVNSFYLPYYSEESGEEKEVLLVADSFDVGRLPPVKDSKGREMEPNVTLESYLAFLKKN